MSDERPLSIGEFSSLTGLSHRAIRWYDREGLIEPSTVDPRTGYRSYLPAQVAVGRLVAVLRRADVPLVDVRTVLDAPDPVEEVRRIQRALQVAHRRQARMLSFVIPMLRGEDSMGYEVATKTVDETPVLSITRRVEVDTLPSYIEDGFTRMLAVAERMGLEQGGPLTAVYHGEVNDDADGPVELWMPITTVPVTDEIDVSRRPAHTVAFTTITEAQLEFPAILDAYRAVSEWITAAGLAHAGPPSEVYIADTKTAAPDDLVCEIQFPVS
jgi:DNA-binding transcriptional MerR regulator/effector-binding domain-containing protein